MKNKKVLIIIIVVVILLLVTSIIMNSKLNTKNKQYLGGNNNAESQGKYDEIDNSSISNSNTILSETMMKEQKEDSGEKNNIIIFSDEEYNQIDGESTVSSKGLTVNGETKTYNQEIISKTNIAYLLGCENIVESTNFDEYINNHIPNNGIYVSNVSGYNKSSNPYDFIKKSSDIFNDLCKEAGVQFEVKNNYVVSNNEKDDFSHKLNKIISGDKKIIIGFVPEYYVYINDIENGLQKGGFTNSSYVKLNPYNNIYTFICDVNHMSADEFYEMLNDIAILSE